MKKIALLWLWFLAAAILSGCALLDENASKIIQSENDQRQYRYVKLENDLSVLLISDRKADKAAASLDVYVGTRQDPRDRQGLAHFLEHMLFLGTEKYPEAGEYQAYINAHGGGHNAYTSFEHTNYFFDIDPDYLEGALDRFSQFFISPLFNETYVQREINAVQSEYLAKIKNDDRRGLDVFKSVINQEHPFSKFSVGSLDTLADEPKGSLREALLDFHARYYSANIMKLVIYGNDSLDELETMASEKFSAIKNKNTPINDVQVPLFKEGDLPLYLTVEPATERRSLSLVFPIPGIDYLYREKPTNYLGNIIGHEGKGSLLSYLKRQGWGQGLSAGAGLSYKGGAMFGIQISLTEAGLTKQDEIIKAVFQSINAIKALEDGEWLFREQEAIASTNFRFKESGAPISYARLLADNLHYYPPKYILQAPYLMDRYDEDLLEDMLSYLSPDNMVVTLTAKGARTEQQSPYYDTPYAKAAFTREQLGQWRSAGVNNEISIPVPNEFIANDFTIIDEAQEQLKPDLIVNRDGLRLWYRQEDKFNVPRGHMTIELKSAIASSSALNSLKLEMLAELTSDALNETLYPALLAGLNASVRSSGRGLNIAISGFNQKQALMLEKVIESLQDRQFDEERFANLKESKLRALRNYSKQQAFRLVAADLQQALRREQFTADQQLAVMDQLTLASVESFADNFFSALEIDALIFGNYPQRQARQVAKLLTTSFLTDEVVTRQRQVEMPETGVAKIQPGVLALERETAYQDAAIMVYVQGDELSKSQRITFGLTGQIINAKFYSTLRTEKQLGYVVASGAYPIYDIPGMYFLIQSPVAGPDTLLTEIRQFLMDKRSGLSTMSEDEFDRQKKSLMNKLLEQPKNLSAQSAQFWGDIVDNYSDFDQREQLIKALEETSFSQWKEAFSKYIANDDWRALIVYANGQYKDQSIDNSVSLDSVDLFSPDRQIYNFK